MRTRRCAHCGESFRPKRSDQKYHLDLCRQAAHRNRKEASDAAAKAAEKEERERAALRVFEQMDAHSFIASTLNALARIDGIQASFMPTQSGVVGVEGRAGALEQANTMLAGFPYLRRQDTVSAEARATLASEDDVTGSIIAREAAAACREAASRGGNIIELRGHQDYIAARNRAASDRNAVATFFGTHGFRCRCGNSIAGHDIWECCGNLFDEDTPDAPRGFPHPLRINRPSA